MAERNEVDKSLVQLNPKKCLLIIYFSFFYLSFYLFEFLSDYLEETGHRNDHHKHKNSLFPIRWNDPLGCFTDQWFYSLHLSVELIHSDVVNVWDITSPGQSNNFQHQTANCPNTWFSQFANKAWNSPILHCIVLNTKVINLFIAFHRWNPQFTSELYFAHTSCYLLTVGYLIVTRKPTNASVQKLSVFQNRKSPFSISIYAIPFKFVIFRSEHESGSIFT